MLIRSRLRLDRTEVRRLLDALSRLKADRKMSVTELPMPNAGRLSATTTAPRDYSLADRIRETKGSVSKIEPNFRLFHHVEEVPRILKKSLRDLSIEMSRNDCASSDGGNLIKHDIYLLRKFMHAIVLLDFSPVKASKEIFYWMSKLRSRPHVLRELTPYAWKLLWTLDAQPLPTLRSLLIGEMMLAGGLELSEEYEINYIGGLFWNDRRDQAVERWQTLVKRRPSAAVWNMGVRMFALERDPRKAEATVIRLIEKMGYVQHKTWIPIIMSYNHIYESEAGWKAYEEMLKWAKNNNEEVTTAQFDDIAMSFLDSGQPAMGLEVYKTMMLLGRKAIDRIKTSVYRNLSPALESAQCETNDPEALNNLSLGALKNLPPHVLDRYFFHNWLKNLMRMGRTDLACFLVQQVMPGRGLPPQSIHWDWIIAGLLKEGHVDQACQTANTMIRARIKQIDDKNAINCRYLPMHRVIAPATIHTFSLLIQYFTRRQRTDQIITLLGQMSECRVRPDSVIMNHLLFAFLRAHDFARLGHLFESMVTVEEVEPDIQTFVIMWVGMIKQTKSMDQKSLVYFSPRRLFKLTVQKLCTPSGTTNVTRLRVIWGHILKSFTRARDLPGMVVALQVGVKVWKVPLDSSVVANVCQCILKARPYTRYGPFPIDKEIFMNTSKIVGKIGKRILGQRARRRNILQKRPSAPETFFDGTVLETLTVMLRHEMKRYDADVDNRIRRVADEMGVDIAHLL